MPICPRCGEHAGLRWTNTGPLFVCAVLWAIPIGFFLLLRTYPFGILAMVVVTWWAVRRVRRVCAHCGVECRTAGGPVR